MVEKGGVRRCREAGERREGGAVGGRGSTFGVRLADRRQKYSTSPKIVVQVKLHRSILFFFKQCMRQGFLLAF